LGAGISLGETLSQRKQFHYAQDKVKSMKKIKPSTSRINMSLLFKKKKKKKTAKPRAIQQGRYGEILKKLKYNTV